MSSPQTYQLSPEWALSQTGNSLLILGGADAKFEIELDSDQKSFFAGLKPNKSFTRKDLAPSEERVLEELITAEIVVPKLSASKKFRVRVIGDSSKLKIAESKAEPAADLLVVVRTTSTYAELLEKIVYQDINTPHLFVDLALHHAVGIGPLVFPGETACIACLQGRVSNRWDDDQPPKAPRAATKYAGMASELVQAEIDSIAGGDTSLTNKTVAWNFQNRAVRQDQLLKVPVCPVCSKNRIDRDGRITLPW